MITKVNFKEFDNNVEMTCNKYWRIRVRNDFDTIESYIQISLTGVLVVT